MMTARNLNESMMEPARSRVIFCNDGHPDRPALEDYVARQYARWFGAELTSYMPTMLGILADSGEIQGALGLRAGAAPEGFYLEHYLDGPTEAALTAAGCPAERAGLVEVGNLASSSAGGTRRLILALTSFLVGAGFEWTVFTATRSLRNSFTRLGATVRDLGAADPARLHDGGAAWGRYYAMDPRVSAVNVAEMRRVLVDGELVLANWVLWSHAAGTGAMHPMLSISTEGVA